MRPRRSTLPFAYALAACLGMLLTHPVEAFAEEEKGVVLGRVFEIDKEKYKEDASGDEASAEDGSSTQPSGGANAERPNQRFKAYGEYLKPRSEVEVIARLLESNREFRSEMTGGGGDYLISELSPGVIEFKLRYEDRDYPVAQRLDAKVNLPFLAELCFVLDKEEQVAWMVTTGPRRSPDVPNWVPDVCESQLSACLGLITDEEDLRKGLLLIFAGSGAAASGVGIAATREKSASPLQ